MSEGISLRKQRPPTVWRVEGSKECYLSLVSEQGVITAPHPVQSKQPAYASDHFVESAQGTLFTRPTYELQANGDWESHYFWGQEFTPANRVLCCCEYLASNDEGVASTFTDYCTMYDAKASPEADVKQICMASVNGVEDPCPPSNAAAAKIHKEHLDLYTTCQEEVEGDISSRKKSRHPVYRLG